MQDQKFQTTDTNNSIEQVNEQEVNEEKLQDITGGCLGCGALMLASGAEIGTSLAKVHNATMVGSPQEATKAATKVAIHGGILLDSYRNFSLATRPCQACATNAMLHVATKGA